MGWAPGAGELGEVRKAGLAQTQSSCSPDLCSRLDRPTRIRFSDSTGNVLFEHPAAPTQDGLVR